MITSDQFKHVSKQTAEILLAIPEADLWEDLESLATIGVWKHEISLWRTELESKIFKTSYIGAHHLSYIAYIFLAEKSKLKNIACEKELESK